MAEINTIIGDRSYELIRDRISEILSIELANQATLSGNTRLNAKVFLERFKPVSYEETPAIVPSLFDGKYNQFTAITQDGVYQFFIDCYESASTSASEDGERRARIRLQKLMGVVQGILSHQKYMTLGFPPPFIEHTEVSGFTVFTPENPKDATSMVMARLLFEVRAPEENVLIDPLPLDQSNTKVELGDSGDGYQYEAVQN